MYQIQELPENAVLCYVANERAYFTTQPLAGQWGDDWGKSFYELNAEEPNLPNVAKGETWQIIRKRPR